MTELERELLDKLAAAGDPRSIEELYDGFCQPWMQSAAATLSTDAVPLVEECGRDHGDKVRYRVTAAGRAALAQKPAVQKPPRPARPAPRPGDARRASYLSPRRQLRRAR